MFTTGARALLFYAAVCSGLLAACDDSPEQTGNTPATTVGTTTKKIAGLAPEMVAAVSAGKTAVMLSVHFALRAPPIVNQALPVDIAIVPHRDFTVLRAHFEVHDGITLVSGDVFGPKPDAAAEKAVPHQLALLPTREGVFMVTAIVETEGADGTVTRIFSIPVIVSAASPAAPSAPATTAKPARPAPVTAPE